ncbi:PDZ domain-containing protein [Verrucomicrobiaceae bacterium N1E253]|uniref:PDZ domain-containing protein n=1 Tax=Oceaniferula marina TaxID=2748318 RepID=A0A851GC56_9BACT|nr:PDZ domain-containing protein [Oceaniferula marina]NWK55006.1 PDZ domain-containing protein [Oceaniferula marina]
MNEKIFALVRILGLIHKVTQSPDSHRKTTTHKMKILRLSLSTLLACPLANAAIHVAPDGSDGADGSKNAPVASIQRAMDLSVQQKDPLILLADGVYFSSAPLSLTAEHSGKEGRARTIKAMTPGKAIISAGQNVEVQWTSYRDGIYQTKIPKDLDLTVGCDGLFIDQQSPRMARFPNYDRSARWLKGSSAKAYSPKRIQSWSDPRGGFLHAMHRAHWGGSHWKITGKKSATECTLEGGWMNNRGDTIHPNDRFVENIFEELDDANEWFLNHKTRTLYFKPSKPLPKGKSAVIFSRHESCVRIEGSEQKAAKHIRFEGVSFRHTSRTFMKTKEPLLRSDWKIYRQGAVFLTGAEHIHIANAEFTQLGGNAYFASGYNRHHKVTGSHFHHVGAGAINFVGDTKAVHNPMYVPYGKPITFDQINKKDRGPKTNDYPANCLAEDNLIHDIGLVEKQVAGLQISVAHKITARHLSIYDVPRAGINVGENAFGGHLIEFCDVFDTVQESSDHGSFNSWGRDRYWHTNYRLVDKQVAEFPDLPKIDMLDRNVIRNSRWRCDHGWDIDLDDGSSWYLIENNLCLGGGIKLREGYHREVRNNLVVANGFHPHVWFKQSEDVIEHNIWAAAIADVRLTGKGKTWDHNIYLRQADLKKAKAYGVDAHGVYAPLQFTDPQSLDYRFKPNAAVTQAGFRPFDLSQFGVQKPNLKSMARTPEPPAERASNEKSDMREYPVLGARFKNVTTLGEVSATGLPDQHGALIIDLKKGGMADNMGLEARDVIRSVNDTPVASCIEFFHAWAEASQPIKVSLWRTQKEQEHTLPAFPGVSLTAADAHIQGGPVYDQTKNYIGRWSNPKASLQWKPTVKSDTTYRVLITQAATNKQPNQWILKGMRKPLHGKTIATGDWEVFQSILLPDSLQSGTNANPTLTLSPDKTKGALMNFRKILLIESGK